MDARVQPGSPGLASSTKFRARLLEAANGLRQGRGPPRAEVAGEIQHVRSSDVAGSPVWQGAHEGAEPAPKPDLPGDMGAGTVPGAPPAGAVDACVFAADAGVVPPDRRTRPALSLRPALVPTHRRDPVSGSGARALRRPG